MEFVGIDKMSLVDFDEYISVTLFTEGCNFRCPFCHNASLVLNQKNAPLNFDDILQLLKDRKGKIDAVVITGGEPLIHLDIIDKIREIKKLGYLIKLDTNGTNLNLLKKLIEEKLIDYVAIDVKNSPKKYDVTSGSKNNFQHVKDSIDYLIAIKFAFELRTTVIKEFHTLEDLIEIANLIAGTPKYVLQKYVDREGCIERGFHPIEETEIKKWQEEIKKIIPNTLLRGY